MNGVNEDFLKFEDARRHLVERQGREGLSADCTLDPMIVMAIMMGGREHPCDRCNKDRKVCRGYPRLKG